MGSTWAFSALVFVYGMLFAFWPFSQFNSQLANWHGTRSHLSPSVVVIHAAGMYAKRVVVGVVAVRCGDISAVGSLR